MSESTANSLVFNTEMKAEKTGGKPSLDDYAQQELSKQDQQLKIWQPMPRLFLRTIPFWYAPTKNR